MKKRLTNYRVRDDGGNLSISGRKDMKLRTAYEVRHCTKHFLDFDLKVLSEVCGKPCDETNRYIHLYEYFVGRGLKIQAAAVMDRLFEDLGADFEFPSPMYEDFFRIQSSFDYFGLFASADKTDVSKTIDTKIVLYLNHPYDTRKTLYGEVPMIDGLNYLDEYKIVSIWKNDGENFSFDYDLLRQTEYVLVHNRGVLFSDAILKLKSFGKKIVFLLDFNPFKVPVQHGAYHYYRALVPRIETLLNVADRVVVSSATLREQIGHDARSLHIGANLQLWTHPVNKEHHDKIRVACIVDEHRVHGIHHLRPVFNHLLEHYAEKIEIYIYALGLDGHELNIFDDLTIVRINAPSYEKWVEYLRAQNIDIVLLFSNNDAFSKSLSGYEMFEYALSNMTMVAANTGPYNGFIEHGVNGYLCGSHMNDWKKALDILITDEQKRIDLSNHAFKKVLDSYTVQHNAASWREILDSVKIEEKQKLEKHAFDTLHLHWKKM